MSASVGFCAVSISIHAPRAGCDSSRSSSVLQTIRNFNPRTPCGVRQYGQYATAASQQDFNPRTPCGVRLRAAESNNQHRDISIHAPRAGCDLGQLSTSSPRSDFNPRTPCGVRPIAASASVRGFVFQSTHPVRGATRLIRTLSSEAFADFNPRTPCGVRLAEKILHFLRDGISIHAPRAGCDADRSRPGSSSANFNPRTPCGVRRQTCTTWFAPIFATLPNQMYVCLHYTCFTTLFQPKTWFSAVFQRCEAPRESMSAPASHRVKASAAPPAHRSAWRRYAQRGSDSYSQDCKSAGCPSPGQSAPPGDA